MYVIKSKYPNGDKIYSVSPTSTRELRRAFLSYGVDAWVTKRGNLIDIHYPSGSGLVKIHPTGLKRLSGMTLKKWVETCVDNAPESNVLHKDYEQYPTWPDFRKYIDNETLPS